MHHGKVQGTEILVEWEVSQIVVDVKEKCVCVVLWWFDSGDPVKFIFSKIEFRIRICVTYL